MAAKKPDRGVYVPSLRGLMLAATLLPGNPPKARYFTSGCGMHTVSWPLIGISSSSLNNASRAAESAVMDDLLLVEFLYLQVETGIATWLQTVVRIKRSHDRRGATKLAGEWIRLVAATGPWHR